MNKLLKFFLPKVTAEILKFFVFLVGAIVLIHFMPIDEVAKSFFTSILLFIAFPIITYFNNVMYLPASLDWILLTPIKKTHIVLGHGLINIFKLVMLFVLINVVMLILNRTFLAGELFDFFQMQYSDGTFTRIRVMSFVSALAIIGLAVIFIFGILPNYVQNIQQRQNYKVKRTPKETLKRSLVIGAGLLAGASILSDDFVFFPSFIIISFVFVSFSAIAIYSTLRSVRFYFSKKTFSYITGALILFSSVSLYLYATNDISSPNLHVINKIESLHFLGSLSNNLDKEIEKDLMASGPSLALMTSRDFKDFFIGTNRDDMAARVLEKWDQVCTEKVNFLCRFAYYMRSNAKEKSISLAMVKKACPTDLGSCFVIYTAFDSEVSKEEMIQNAQQAQEVLTKRCNGNKNEYELKTCRLFQKEMKDQDRKR